MKKLLDLKLNSLYIASVLVPKIKAQGLCYIIVIKMLINVSYFYLYLVPIRQIIKVMRLSNAYVVEGESINNLNLF